MTAPRPVFVDFEATSIYASEHGEPEALELAIVDDDGSVLLDTLIRPTRHPTWPDGQRVHGISPAMVTGAPTFEELRPTVAALLRDRLLVAYNADFDLSLLPADCRTYRAVACACEDFAAHVGQVHEYYGDYTKWKLSEACADILYPLRGAHRALSDARACRAVWRYLHDPDERALVDALKADQRSEETARYEVRRAEGRAQTIAERLQRERTTFWMRWLRFPLYMAPHRVNPFGPHWEDGYSYFQQNGSERLAYEEELHRVFCGMAQRAWTLRQEHGELPTYRHRRDVPKHLVALRTLNAPTWARAYLVPSAYLETAIGNFSLLYDRTNALDVAYRKHPLRRPYTGPAPLCTTSELRSAGYSAREIQALKPVSEYYQQLSRAWFPLFHVPAEELATRRADKAARRARRSQTEAKPAEGEQHHG